MDLFLHARNYFANFGIQILRSNDGAQFLIGDVPSLTIGQDGKNVGLSGGVPLYDAQTLIMPFGPRFAVSLTKQNEWVDVGVEEVNWVNQIQLSAAHEHVYFHVESGLENLAQEVRPAKNLRVSSP
ncbi:MAG: DUF4238 domain-containing protein [Acidobacteria bacterium]|nr:DUF4238 domain-containing protein [Acidobacteriota bacterium]